MKRLPTLALVLASVFVGCADDPLTSPPTGLVSADPTRTEASAHAVLSAARGPGHGGPPGTFSGPLFGLATAPNGDILVADAGAGVVDLRGRLEVPLPGVTDVAMIGRGSMWAVVGAGSGPGGEPVTDEFSGQALYRASRGSQHVVANLFAFEEANDPDGQGVDSNPFDVASLRGNAVLVADAAANALLRVDNRGRVEVLAVFPNELVSTANVKGLLGCPGSGAPPCGLPPMIPAQAVPTSVAVGPDGHYYVGELKGFPAPTGESNVWRVSPNASNAQCGSSPDCVRVFDGGFTSIIDLAFDAAGRLHVAELDERSWFSVELGAGVGGSINSCDLGTQTCVVVASGIPILTAITFGRGGSLWATRQALIPGLATVFEVP